MAPQNFDFEKALLFPAIVNANVLTGLCMCHCVHCPLGRTPAAERGTRFPHSEMSLELFQTIADEMAQYPASLLRIHSVGDPLYWPHLTRALEYAFHRSLKTWIFTSAATTNLDLLHSICDLASIVEISVNSIEANDYRQTKGIDTFPLVKSNIEAMAARIQSRNRSTRLIVSRVESMDSEADSSFVDYWNRSGVVSDAFVRSYHTYNNTIEPQSESLESIKSGPCLVHWARFNIDTNGDVYVCFNELFKQQRDHSLILGNLQESTIQTIWSGERLDEIRRAELSSDYKGISFCKTLACEHCKTCQPLFGSRDTSEKQIKSI